MKKYFLVLFVLVLRTIVIAQSNDILVMTTSYWGGFLINLQENRFCHYRYGERFGEGIKYCKGNIGFQGDTILLIKDYDQTNLPINVKSDYLKDHDYNRIIINFIKPDTTIENERYYCNVRNEKLYIVINNEDTLSLKNDTIIYQKEIKSFYIQYLETKDLLLYKTEYFYNQNKHNQFNINYQFRYDYIVYDNLDAKIILKGNEALLLVEKNLYLLKKIKYRKFIKLFKEYTSFCNCWNEKGILDFSKENW